MRAVLLFAAALCVTACERPEPFDVPVRPHTARALFTNAGYNASWNHQVLALLPNVMPSNAESSGSRINEAGWVAGTTWSYFDNHFFSTYRATLWTPAGALNLGTLPPHSPSQNSHGQDVNDAGAVAGWGTGPYSSGVCCGLPTAFHWTQQTGMVPLQPLAADRLARATALNNLNQIVGSAVDASGSTRAVLWPSPAQAPQPIGPSATSSSATDINDAGVVVGTFSVGPVSGVFRWSAANGAVTLAHAGYGWAVPYAINNAGWVVGFAATADDSWRPVRWSPAGVLEELPLPAGATHAFASAINDAGHIAITAQFDVDGNPTQRAFLWVEGQLIDLGHDDLANSGVTDINEQVQLSGYGIPPLAGYNRAVRWDVALTPVTGGFAFDGFYAPVHNLPTVNRAAAGQAIPVKFSLGGDFGLNIFAAGYPASQPISCDASAPTDQVESTVNAGSSSLGYDAATARYSYIWKTERGWAGSCRKLVVKLTDGSEHSAVFRFTR